MNDEWTRLARTIAEGTRVTEGENVSIFLTDADSVAAAQALVAEVYRRGAFPQVMLTDERFDREALAHAPHDLLARVPDLEAEAMRWSDVHISLRGMVPPGAPPDSGDDADHRLAAQRRAKGAISALRWSETRWAVVRVPTDAWAEFAGLDRGQLFDEFFAGCTRDWEADRQSWRRLADRLEQADTVRITSPDTDLTLPVRGRSWAVFAGEANLPDGEIATAPLEDKVSGYITIDERFYFAGRAIAGLRLTFDEGVVVGVEAAEGGGLARALVQTDAGAARVGELGIGTNPAMATMTGDLFFDEKVLGTVHIALGRAYPQCGGTNESALHWDIVKDLRPGRPGGAGDLLVDGTAWIQHGQVTGDLAG